VIRLAIVLLVFGSRADLIAGSSTLAPLLYPFS
jgi:hypothetical protein